MRGPEGVLQDKILKDLRSYGKLMVCTKVMKTSDNGFPDIFFTTFHTGAVVIETKQEHGVASKLQESRIQKLNNCGTKAFICNTWPRWIEIKQELGLPLPAKLLLFESVI